MKSLGKVYMHVSNSGAVFEVIDEGYGPTLKVSSSAFGNLQHELRVHTDTQSLEILGQMLLEAAEQEFSPPYCILATAHQEPRVLADSKDSQSEQPS